MSAQPVEAMPVHLPLDNQQWEAFARQIASGKSNTEAYTLAYGATGDVAKSNGCRLLTNAYVSDRVAWLKQQNTGKTVLSAIERREWLAKLVNTPAQDIDGSSPLCNGLKPGKDGQVQVLIPDKLAALKLDALLSGDLAQAQGGQELKIGIFNTGDGNVSVSISGESAGKGQIEG